MLFTVGPKIAKVKGPLSMVTPWLFCILNPVAVSSSLLDRLKVVVSRSDNQSTVYWAKNQMELELEDPKAGLLCFPDMIPSIGVVPDVTPCDGLSVGAPRLRVKRTRGLHGGIWLMN